MFCDPTLCILLSTLFGNTLYLCLQCMTVSVPTLCIVLATLFGNTLYLCLQCVTVSVLCKTVKTEFKQFCCFISLSVRLSVLPPAASCNRVALCRL
jgi:hypothetical protein